MNHTIKSSICMLLMLAASALWAQGPDLSEARALLAMPDREALEKIKTYNADEAEILITQVLSLTRPNNPNVDRVYHLVRHLEILRADAHAQNRLDTLLVVLGITFALFTVFLIFVLLDQRRSIQALQKLLGERQNFASNSAASDPNAVYRGE